jgi:hypothetical protein
VTPTPDFASLIRATGLPFRFQTAKTRQKGFEIVIASEAKQSNQKQEWIASSRSLSSGAHSRDPLAPRNDVETQFRDLAAHCARALPEIFLTLHSEGAGNAGRWMRPQRRVQNNWKHTT